MADYGEALSEREVDVLNCIASGLSNKEAAESLSISPYTVKTHLRNIYTKLGASSRTEAARLGMEQGFILTPGQTPESETSSEMATAVNGTPPDPLIQPMPVEGQVARNRVDFRLSFILAVIGLIGVAALFWQFSNGRLAGSQIQTFEITPLGNKWSQTTLLKHPRAHMATASVGLFIYFIGGEDADGVINEVLVLDTLENQVEQREPKPTAVTHASAAVLYGEIYVAGGKDASGSPTNVVEAYSPTNDAWRPVASLPVPLSGVVVLANENSGSLYVIGGSAGETAVDVAYRYDVNQDSWEELPDMPTVRANAAGGLIDDELIIVGGEDEDGTPLASCVRFNLSIEQWRPCRDMGLARTQAGAVAFINKLYVFGGMGGETAVAEAYNPQTDTWETILDPDIHDSSQSWTGLGVSLVETNIFAAGGLVDGEYSPEAYIYAPLANRIYLPAASGNN